MPLETVSSRPVTCYLRSRESDVIVILNCVLSSLEKKQEHKAEIFFGRGREGDAQILLVWFFSILLSDNCDVFAVAIPFEKTSRGCF